MDAVLITHPEAAVLSRRHNMAAVCLTLPLNDLSRRAAADSTSGLDGFGGMNVLTLHPFLFFFDLLAADEQASAELMLFAHLAQLVEDLQGQFPRGRDDKGTQAIQRAPLQSVQLLQHLCMPNPHPLAYDMSLNRI